jgi:RimJ/RimL family protein N-acetyltransferase
MVVPPLDTERLALRAHCLEDFADSAALWADPMVVRYIGGRPFTAEEVWTRLLRHIGHWAALGFGYWVARDRASGRFVGEVGFADLHRDITPPLGVPEAGWVLAPSAHGRGLAAEAVQACLDWSAAQQWARVVCIIHPGNAASIRVAAKCDFRKVMETTYRGDPTILFEHVR